jgi:translocation and assembly module TamB
VFEGDVTGNLGTPHLQGKLTVGMFSLSGKTIDSLAGDVTAAPDAVRLQNATVNRGSLRAQVQGIVALDDWKTSGSSQIFGGASTRNAPVAELAELAGSSDFPLTGTLFGTAQFSGTLSQPLLTADLEVVNGALQKEPFERLALRAAYANRTLDVTSGDLAAPAGQARFSASYRHSPQRLDAGRLRFDLSTGTFSVERLATLREERPDVRGSLQITANGEFDVAPATSGVSLRLTALHGDATARNLQLTGQKLGDAHLTAQSEGQDLHAQLDADFANSVLRGQGRWRLENDFPGNATVTFSRLDFAQLSAWLTPDTAQRLAGFAEGELRVDGPALKPEAMRATLRLARLEIGAVRGSGIPDSVALRNSGPLVLTLANSVVNVDSARLTGRLTDLTIGGRINLKNEKPLDLNLNGRIDLAVLQDFNPDFSAIGSVTSTARVQGDWSDPLIDGRLQFQNAAFNIADFPNGISSANGTIVFTGRRATIQTFTGETGGGRLSLTGFASYGAGTPVFRVHAEARQVRVRYPEGVSTVANADLNLTGTPDRSTLSGAVTILRTGFNPQSDFSSIIAQSAEPVRTPSARTGLLGGLTFEVQVNTDPNIEFQSSLTQDIQVEAHLSLRGTPTNPAVVGRVNITQGQVLFFGTRYTINQGSISFYNPLKIEPILDIDLETKARGVDVTLSITGPLNKWNLTPRSDPPLQFNEIVALLATGHTPTSDPTLLAQQSTAPQSWQQMGATTLLGQAIASPVAGRLQRFFGVSKLRIDPTLPGIESNPQARLTLEQQITPDLTFTYITNVTNSNPQVIRVEWAVSKQWSVVALREENGVFGLDFFFKRRF